ncbi:MAG: YfgM family protein [Pseudomonadota bacterium]
MEIYNSEQEQVEALKAWWDKNGRMVIAAIVLLLLGVLGWQSWQGHQAQRAESAAAAYQQMADQMVDQPEAALETGRAINGEYSGTIYATMASLAMGRIAVEQSDLDSAAAHLRAALSQAKQPEMKLLARLRLARVLLAQGQAEAALGEIDSVDGGPLQGAFDELRGDIQAALGDLNAARDAYTNAVAAFSEQPQRREVVQIKLDDLAESKTE